MLSANDVASVIIARSAPWLDAMSLQKFLYYVQAWHLAITDEPLFEEHFKAFRDGPVVYEVWQARKDQQTRRASDQTTDDIMIDDAASDLIDLVLTTYGSMSGEELSALTHVEAPWRQARGNLPAEAHGTTVISHESMARFYRAHRRLGGRTAADWAAAGIHVSSMSHDGPIDVDEILRGFDDDLLDPGVSDWGSSNLEPKQYAADGIGKERRRAHAGA